MMRSVYFIASVLALLLAMPGISSAACASTFAVCSSGFTDWLPIILTAAVTVISLTVLYYFAGIALNNSRIRASAQIEIQQALGTILLIVIILGIMYMIGSGTGLAYQSLLSGGPNSVTNGLDNLCTKVLPNSQVGFLNPTATSAHYPGYSGPAPYPTGPYPDLPQETNAVCQIITGGSGLDPATQNLDYGLAATYVITANLTNQSIEELNALYNFDSFTFFLRGIQSYASICEPVTCFLPFTARYQESTLYYKLFNGYVLHRTVMPSVITQANISIYLFVSEMILIIILLLTWPYLLAAGILLRLFTVTRRAGGFIIAAVITGTILYPTLFMFQYAGLSNLAPLGSTAAPAPGQIQALGASSIPASVSLCGVSINTPVISTYTTPQPGEPAITTEYELFCYTPSEELPINAIYYNLQPSCNTGQNPPAGAGCATSAANNNCGIDFPGWKSTSGIICACAAGTSTMTTTSPTTQVPTCYVQKDLSFYTFPSEADVIRLHTCYPPDYANNEYYSNTGTGPSGMMAIEVGVINALDKRSPLTVLLTLSTVFSQLTGASVPASGLSPIGDLGAVPCNSIAPQNLLAALEATINLYGIISVVGFILPIINVLMLISATFGLSQLLGGETNIIGLSRFI